MRNILKFRNKWTNGFLSPKPTWHENQHDMTVKIGLLPQKESRLPTINFHSSETGWAQIYGLFLQASNKIQHTSGTYPQTQKKPPVDERNPEPSLVLWDTVPGCTWGPCSMGSTLEFSNISTRRKFTRNASAIESSNPKRYSHCCLGHWEVAGEACHLLLINKCERV